MSTPTPLASGDLQSIGRIYQSGDLMLNNPAESGIIFVSVILVSALLEWVLQRASNIENRYARMMVETMSQEVTIVGVLALLLMFGTSLIPSGYVAAKYVTLFTWANMCLFFMAFFFVGTILLLFAWAGFDAKRWRTFQEGRMDTEDEAKLSYRERLYKKSAQRFLEEVKSKHGALPTDSPFYEFLSMNLRRRLVRVSNLSYRTWFWLSIVVLANLARCKATPFLQQDSEDDTFDNAMMFIGIIGWGTLLTFLAFFGLLQRRWSRYVDGMTEPELSGAFLVPFGAPKRALEFVQVLMMTYNWYVTLYVTGLAKETTRLRGYQLGVVISSFAIPILVFAALLPWTMMSIAVLGSLGSVTSADLERVQRTVRGEAVGSDDDSGGEEEGPSPEHRPRRSEGQLSARRGSIGGASTGSNGSRGTNSRRLLRPSWLDADEDWDGHRTLPVGERTETDRLEHLYYNSVDAQKLARLLRTQLGVAPTSQPNAQEDPRRPSRQGRPSWADSDDDI